MDVHTAEFLDLVYLQRPINNNVCILKLQKKNFVTYRFPEQTGGRETNIMHSSGVCFNREGRVKASKLCSVSTSGVVYLFIVCAGLFGTFMS